MEFKNFKETLVANHDKSLVFVLPDRSEVRRGFHLTEIKKATLATIDCGGEEHNWNETIIQLWSPKETTEKTMKGKTAAGILRKSDDRLRLLDSSTVVFEFGEGARENLYPTLVSVVGDELRIQLAGLDTGCKALHRYEMGEQKLPCC